MNRSQRIAIWVLALIGLLAAWKLFGQGFGNFRTDQPFLARTSAAILSPEQQASAGLAYRWVYTDMDTNGAVVTNWPDRIQGLAFTNGFAAARPTNYSDGVDFQGKALTNAAMSSVGTNVAFGFIININNVKGNGGVRPGLLMNTADLVADTDQVAGWCGYYDNGALGWQGGAIQYQLSEAPYASQGIWNDLVFVQTDTNVAVTGHLVGYTNTSMFYSNAILGAKWGGTMVPNTPNSLGFNQPRTATMYFKLKELWVWTNAGPGIPLSSVTLSNFHKYATNVYGYTP